LRDLNRGSEWDFGSEKDIILIAFFFWILDNNVRNDGKVRPQTWAPLSEERIDKRAIKHDKNRFVGKMSHF